ncbi:MAG TPA: RagB/SusD family nutrient uptake outer membrane protein [Prolixibacteraceae bacterium]|jgi:tetratricopeptide (TPR) repeat protein
MKILNIKSTQLLAILVVVFTGFSCSDKFFDEQAGERITPDQHYKSVIDAQNSLAGAFVPLQAVLPKLIMIDGLRSDMMTPTSTADAYLKDLNNQVLSFDNPYLDASDYYKVIVNANEALANLAKIAAVDRDFDDYTMKYTKGALVGLKSWTYLTLIRLYGQAALIDDNLVALPENLNQTILTKDAMLDVLIEGLLPYIPSTEELTQKLELRFTNFMNNKAVLGELYLEKGDYANAAIYLKMAIESYKNSTDIYKVNSYSNEAWKTMFLGGESGTGSIPPANNIAPSENISVMAYDQNEGQFNPLARWILPTDQFMVQPSQILINDYKTQIPLKGTNGDVYRGIGATIDTTSSGVYYINKYSINKAEPFSSDITISRAADLHLLLAEALNRNGESATALIILNQGFKPELKKPALYTKWSKNLGIRGRAYLQSVVVPDSAFLTPGAVKKSPLTGADRINYIEDLIMTERSMELAFEGKRWFDLVRVAKRRQDPAYLANKVAAKFTNTAEGDAVRAKLMNENNWYLPFKKEIK